MFKRRFLRNFTRKILNSGAKYFFIRDCVLNGNEYKLGDEVPDDIGTKQQRRLIKGAYIIAEDSDLSEFSRVRVKSFSDALKDKVKAIGDNFKDLAEETAEDALSDLVDETLEDNAEVINEVIKVKETAETAVELASVIKGLVKPSKKKK